jgi:hypothetical protein
MSNLELKQPILNLDKIQDKVNESAKKAADSVIEEFYTSYNSPYKKALKEHLEQQKGNIHFELPSILEIINKAIQEEINLLANKAIATTYLPMVSDILISTKKEINFSEILKAYVEMINEKEDDVEIDDFFVEVKQDKEFDWLNIVINYSSSEEFTFTLHRKRHKDKEHENNPLYNLLSPYHDKGVYKSTTGIKKEMEISKDNFSVKIPYENFHYYDNFRKLLVKLLINKTDIKIDSQDFDEDWIERDECRC